MNNNWQKFQEEFCGKCMHYFYVGGKKIFQNQSRICQKGGGECKKFLGSVIEKAREIHKDKITPEKYYDDYVKRCSYRWKEGCITTGKICSYNTCFIIKRKFK